MSRPYSPYIAALAALWGASYMFIKVADRAFEPATEPAPATPSP
jgi:hypothetical protein